jgi:hypothetical protein
MCLFNRGSGGWIDSGGTRLIRTAVGSGPRPRRSRGVRRLPGCRRSMRFHAAHRIIVVFKTARRRQVRRHGTPDDAHGGAGSAPSTSRTAVGCPTPPRRAAGSLSDRPAFLHGAASPPQRRRLASSLPRRDDLPILTPETNSPARRLRRPPWPFHRREPHTAPTRRRPPQRPFDGAPGRERRKSVG